MEWPRATLASELGEGSPEATGGSRLSRYSASDRARFVTEDPARKRADRDDFARDRGRIVHSSALRRLSTKTQVWQAGTDDFVRNRLTHSLEVAQIGRELAQGIGCHEDLVDAACLAHDIGHPPFGHFGETVLDVLASDIGGFEGNAQTFRLLSRLEPKRHDADGRPVGLNLTRATLDAATKYPWRRGEGPEGTRKFGVYDDDLPIFEFARQGSGSGTCIEAQVMDWADDVAYSVHDLEDAIAAGAVPLDALRDRQEQDVVVGVAQRLYARSLDSALLAEALRDLVDIDLPKTFQGSDLLREQLGSRGVARAGGTRADLAGLKDMTSSLIGRFAAAPEDATREQYGSGPLVRYEAKLVVPERVRAEVAVLKAVVAHFVMLTSSRESQLATQREAVEALVAHFTEHPEDLDPMFLADLQASNDSAVARRVVIDQVASLTDGRALRMFHEVS